MARDRTCPGLHFLAEARYTAPARGTVVQVVSTSFLERGAAAVVEPNLALPCSETGELPVQGDANVGAPDPELTRQREGRPDLYSVVSKGPNMTLMSCPQLRAYGLPLPNLESDRQDSNPLPSEPQSADIGCSALLWVAESAYLSPFLCSRLRAIAACCALGGVSSGVNFCAIRHGESFCTRPRCCVEARLSRQP
jgi:hypothetical protein